VSDTPPADTASPDEAPSPQGPEFIDCEPDDLVDALQASVPYEEFSLSQNVIEEVRNLNLWFVDPSLDPLAQGDDVAGNTALARFHAARVSHTLEQEDECIAVIFTGLTSIVVDRDYNVWFSGQISPDILPQAADPSDDDLEAAGERFVVGYARTEETSSFHRPPSDAGACSWPEVREGLRSHFEPGQQNLSFYLAIDDSGVNVWAQWEGPEDEEAFFLDILTLRSELACLYPPLDTFWGILVDGTGEAYLVVAAPGEAVREANDADLLSRLEVVYPYLPQ
jgi:hypothetical protein